MRTPHFRAPPLRGAYTRSPRSSTPGGLTPPVRTCAAIRTLLLRTPSGRCADLPTRPDFRTPDVRLVYAFARKGPLQDSNSGIPRPEASPLTTGPKAQMKTLKDNLVRLGVLCRRSHRLVRMFAYPLLPPLPARLSRRPPGANLCLPAVRIPPVCTAGGRCADLHTHSDFRSPDVCLVYAVRCSRANSVPATACSHQIYEYR